MTKVTPAKQSELKSFLKRSPDWVVNKRGTNLSRTFDFTDYVQGLIFIARISVHAEVLGHHPELTLSYGKVKVVLTTHDIKTLSSKDINLAKKIDSLYS